MLLLRANEEMNEERLIDMEQKTSKSNSAEPYFYIALVLKGNEKQYLDLLKYVNNRNGAQVIYQCKSLTYLRIARENCPRPKTDLSIQTIDLEDQEAQMP
jgi:hypothetical protein